MRRRLVGLRKRTVCHDTAAAPSVFAIEVLNGRRVNIASILFLIPSGHQGSFASSSGAREPVSFRKVLEMRPESPCRESRH